VPPNTDHGFKLSLPTIVFTQVHVHDRNRTKFNQKQEDLPYQIAILTAIIVAIQNASTDFFGVFGDLMSWKSRIKTLIFLWVVEYCLYMGIHLILIPLSLAILGIVVYQNANKVRWMRTRCVLAGRCRRFTSIFLMQDINTALVLPEQKKQSFKEFINTIKEIPSIIDQIQSTLQVRIVQDFVSLTLVSH